MLVTGEIRDAWPEAPGKKSFRSSAGEFLTCQCIAAGEVALEVPKAVTRAGAKDILPAAFSGVLHAPRTLAPDVMSFGIHLDRACAFDAGQFVLVRAPGHTGFRAYSMCNYGSALERLDFVIKRKAAGGFSEWLFAGGREGEQLEVFGPLGRATLEATAAKNIVCIAGGSGIAGMMSILACADARRYFEAHRGWVFFGVRTLADAFLLRELSELGRRWPESLNITVALSHEAVPERAGGEWPALQFAHGFVHEAARDAMKGNYANLRAYIAGPPPAVEAALRMLLVEGKLPASEIRYDKFS
jgi:toluene monooxygenase electron transfer component